MAERRSRAGGAFNRLWVGHGAANLGFGVFSVAVPLAAASLTRSPVLVATVTVALGLPWLLVALPAGALVDRADRRRVAVAVTAGRAALLAALAVLIAAGWLSIAALCVVAFAFAVGSTTGHAAMDALLPQVVDGPALPDANRKIKSTAILNRDVVGSASGGALAATSLATPFVAAAALFTLSAGALWSLRGDYRVGDRGHDEPLGASVRAGLRFLWASPVLRSLGLMLSVISTAVAMHVAVFVLYATSPSALGLGELGYGLLFVAKAAGAIGTALVLRPATSLLGEAVLVRLAVASAVVFVLTPGLLSGVAVVAASMLLGGAGEMAYMVTAQTLRQRVTPPRLLGRVTSAYALITWGPMALGAALAGVVGELFGLRAVFLVSGALVALCAPVLLRGLTQEAVDAALQRVHPRGTTRRGA